MNARSSSSKRVAEDALLDPVGEPAGVEPILELPVPVVVEVGHSEMMRFMPPRVHLSERVSAPRSSASSRPTSSSSPSPVGADGIVAMLTVTVDDAYLEAAGPQLRIVANYAVGVNNIDLEAARRRGHRRSPTRPDVLTGATAELALTLMLSLLRRVTEGDRFVRRREPWEFSLEFMLGERLAGKTVLIVGAGRIGRETARLAEAFGATAVLAGRDADLDALLGEADVVSLHVPLTAETRHLIDARRLALMKPSAVLINTARGPVVDEAALAEALRTRHDRGRRARRLRARAGGHGVAARARERRSRAAPRQRHPRHPNRDGDALRHRAPRRPARGANAGERRSAGGGRLSRSPR